jgi:RNA polymerase sigma-70 factor (ECF subfamily)
MSESRTGLGIGFIERIGRSGPRRDFERAVKDELPTLYRVAKRMVRNPDDAEDLVQQCLVKAFRAWDRFDGNHLRSWLIRIMRNELASNKRSLAAQAVDAELDESIVSQEPFWDEVTWRVDADHVLRELEELPAEFRLTLHLCDVEQFTYEEAAEAMGVPIGTVRSRLFRARSLLRERLAGIVCFVGSRP